MIRLTKDLRNSIERKLLERRYRSQLDELRTRGQTLFVQAAYAHFDEQFQVERRALLREVPPSWLEEWRYMYIGPAGGYQNYLPSNGRIDRVADWSLASAIDKPHTLMPSFNRNYRCAPDNPILKSVLNYYSDAIALDKEISEAGRKIRQTLNAFSSVERLVEAWPEVKPFVPSKKEEVSAAVANLPMVLPAELNVMLDLPVE